MEKNDINQPLSDSEKLLAESDSVLSGCLATWVEDRRANTQLVSRLIRGDKKERDVLVNWIEVLAPSANTLREFLRLADEVAARDGITAGEVLAAPELEKLLCAEGISRKDKQRLLREELEARRYPIRRRILERLTELQEQIAIETGAKVELPEDLEGDSIVFCLRARSPQQLATSAAQLAERAMGPGISELFAVMLGKIENLGIEK